MPAKSFSQESGKTSLKKKNSDLLKKFGQEARVNQGADVVPGHMDQQRGGSDTETMISREGQRMWPL